MRPLLALAMVALAAACQRTPEQQQADQMRSDARQLGDAIKKQADIQVDHLQQQASDLENEANQVGGMTGERLSVRADGLEKEAKIVRKQAAMRADAIKEATDARIKASQSR